MKKTVFAFLLGVVLTGSTAGVVALNYNAKNIGYTPSDNSWNVNNVEDAIKDLKNIDNKRIQIYSTDAVYGVNGTYWQQNVEIPANVKNVTIYLISTTNYAVDTPTISGDIIALQNTSLIHETGDGKTYELYFHKIDITTNGKTGTITVNSNGRVPSPTHSQAAEMIVIY